MSRVHVVLLGDSVFDNGAYVPGEPAVPAQLGEIMPDARVTLLARDGDDVGDIAAQMSRLPADATHLVISVGGNDALGYIDVLTEQASGVGEALLRMAGIAEEFERGYRRMLEVVHARRLPVAACTIYYPAFQEEGLQRMAVAAETFFNDVILRCAFEHGMPLLDLRLICDEPADYANPIEPSARGGWKIASVIARVVRAQGFDADASAVYTQP